MISCTEFIPLYSEFFKFLEEQGGHDAVMEYWYHISDTSIGDKTNPNSLIYKCEELGGFDGSIAYWGRTLKEEASDLFHLVEREKRFKYAHMRHCPSRGRLNELSHIEPYYDYCEHCNVIYQRVLDDYGIVFERDNSRVDRAECRSMLYEKGNRPDFDWRNISDEDAKKISDNIEVIDMKSGDNKYLHRDFHLSGDKALRYCAQKYGYEAMIQFLTNYVNNYYSPQIKDIKERGLIALKEWIESVYEVEEASELLHTQLSGKTMLTVTVDKSPVIEYMHSLNQEPSEYYIEETRTLYKAMADACGFRFELKYYTEEGAAKFTFSTM